MLNQKKITYSLDDVELVAQKVLPYLKKYSVVTLSGPLGAGKTTLVQAILAASGVEDTITSPTFTYLNVYTGADDIEYYHFDLYRLSTEDEFLAAGFDEYLYAPNSRALIEWPGIIKDLLDHSVCNIILEYQDDDTRALSIKCIE
jgi:tRNA threonylcarbamoyladenosine biosynthesis protein TsaE